MLQINENKILAFGRNGYPRRSPATGLQAVLYGRGQSRSIGLAGRDGCGRLHHHPHLLDAGSLAELLGHLGDRSIDDVGQLRLGERRG